MIKGIIFEGVDGSGKTTLIKYLNKKSDYAFFCVDRMGGSGYVYDGITGRRTRVKDIFKFEKKLAENFILVYCYAPKKVLLERLREKKHDISRSELAHHLKTFDYYLTYVTPLRYIKIKTTDDINKSYDRILKFAGDEHEK